MSKRKRSALVHKYVQETEAGRSAWAVLCSPQSLNCKYFKNDWKKKNAAFHWRLITCKQCLRLRKMSRKETYTIRKGLKFLAKDVNINTGG